MREGEREGGREGGRNNTDINMGNVRVNNIILHLIFACPLCLYNPLFLLITHKE